MKATLHGLAGLAAVEATSPAEAETTLPLPQPANPVDAAQDAGIHSLCRARTMALYRDTMLLLDRGEMRYSEAPQYLRDAYRRIWLKLRGKA